MLSVKWDDMQQMFLLCLLPEHVWPQDKNRTRPMSDFEDTRVDVCLYFIAPHNLRPVDIEMMNQIGQLVPVIPVIAKVSSRLPPHTLTQCKVKPSNDPATKGQFQGYWGCVAMVYMSLCTSQNSRTACRVCQHEDLNMAVACRGTR